MGENEHHGRRRLSGRCMVLVSPDRADPVALVTALTRKGLTVQRVSHEMQVMAELSAGGVTLVVVVEPDAMMRVGELRDAVREHFPDVLCWKYAIQAAGKMPRLVSLDPPSNLKNSNVSPQKQVSPIGRIVGRRRTLDRLAVSVPGPSPLDPLPPAKLVSDEELSMLLGPAPGEVG